MWIILIDDFFVLRLLVCMGVSISVKPAVVLVLWRTHIDVVSQVRWLLITCVYWIFDTEWSLKVNGYISDMIVFMILFNLVFLVVDFSFHLHSIMLPERCWLVIEGWCLYVFFRIVLLLLQLLHYSWMRGFVVLQHEVLLKSHPFVLLFRRTPRWMRNPKIAIAKTIANRAQAVLLCPILCLQWIHTQYSD